jgi:Na+-driven multidrug efflux pump
MIAVGGMIITSVVNGYSVAFIAGFTASNKLYGVLEIAATSYGYAVTTYVGQNYGAMDLDRVKKGMRSATFLAVVTSLVISTVMLVFGREITMIFISRDDPVLAAEAGNIAYWYLCAMSVSLPVLYLLYVYQSGLQGMGNTVVPMLSGMLEFALRVSLSITIAVTGFRYGIFGAEVSAWWGAAIFLTVSYFRHYNKAKKKHSP